jgi:hypothetical protein
MRRGIARLGPVVLTAWLTTIPALAREPAPEESRLRAHVATLASAEYQGRRGAGGARAADYLAAEFRRLGLDPLFGDSFFQAVPGKEGEPPLGRNVGAALRGSDPTLRDEWVIVSAHFDHLGTRNGVLYPGADDNASGVAMMLEVARSLAVPGRAPRRSLMFIGFDLEESGLWGSRYFVEHAPVPLGRVALFLTADMIGRSLGGVCDPYVFVMGSEHAPGLRPWIADAAKGSPVTVGILGTDLLMLDRSDYGPFRARKVPYLFFTTGESPVYHTPRDTPDTLNYAKAEAISRVILGVVRRSAEADRVPAWSPAPDHAFAEAVTIRDVLRTLLQNREALKIGPAQSLLMNNALRTLDVVVRRGTITPEERTVVIRVARVVLISVL